MLSFKNKQESIKWARNLILDDDGFYVIDFETNGLPKNGVYPEPVSMAIIKVAPVLPYASDGYKVILNQQFKPVNPIDQGAAAIHGLTAEKLADKPSFAEFYPDIVKALHKEKVVIYNAAFDAPVLDAACMAHKLPCIKPQSVSCAMQAYSAFNGELHPKYKNYIWHKLTKACANHGITTDNAHEALSDTVMTYKLIKFMALSTEKVKG